MCSVDYVRARFGIVGRRLSDGKETPLEASPFSRLDSSTDTGAEAMLAMAAVVMSSTSEPFPSHSGFCAGSSFTFAATAGSK